MSTREEIKKSKFCPKMHLLGYINKNDERIKYTSCDICTANPYSYSSGSNRCEICNFDRCDRC